MGNAQTHCSYPRVIHTAVHSTYYQGLGVFWEFALLCGDRLYACTCLLCMVIIWTLHNIKTMQIYKFTHNPVLLLFVHQPDRVSGRFIANRLINLTKLINIDSGQERYSYLSCPAYLAIPRECRWEADAWFWIWPPPSKVEIIDRRLGKFVNSIHLQPLPVTYIHTPAHAHAHTHTRRAHAYTHTHTYTPRTRIHTQTSLNAGT